MDARPRRIVGSAGLWGIHHLGKGKGMACFAGRNTLGRAIALALALPLAATALNAQAQDAETTGTEGAKQLDSISVLGSRRVDRSSETSTPVPVDVIPMAEQAESGAQFDLAQSLQSQHLIQLTRQTVPLRPCRRAARAAWGPTRPCAVNQAPPTVSLSTLRRRTRGNTVPI